MMNKAKQSTITTISTTTTTTGNPIVSAMRTPNTTAVNKDLPAKKTSVIKRTTFSEDLKENKIFQSFEICSKARKNVKYSIIAHFLASIVILVQMGCHFGEKYLPDEIKCSTVPKPNLWQFGWLTSLIPALVGVISLRKFRLSLMKFYYYGTFMCGFLVSLFTLLINTEDMIAFARTKKTANLFFNIPLIVIWYFYLIILLQIHLVGIYFSRVVIKIWTEEAARVKKSK